MRKLVAACVVVSSVLGLVGCGQSGEPSSKESVSTSVAPLQASDLEGRWQFVFTDEVRAKYRARIALEIADPAELEQAMKDADAEARASDLEFTKDHVFVSRVLGEEIVRQPYEARVASKDALTFAMNGKDKSITFRDRDTIEMVEPVKGTLVYVRVK